MHVPIGAELEIPDAQKLLVNLKIQLKYDRISQANFIKVLVNAYLERDKRIMEIFEENLKILSSREKARKDEILTKKTIRDFNLNDEEVEDIFDILAKENPNL